MQKDLQQSVLLFLEEDCGRDMSVEILSRHPRVNTELLYDIGALCVDMYAQNSSQLYSMNKGYDIIIYMMNNAIQGNDCGFYNAAFFKDGVKVDEVDYIIHESLDDSEYFWH